MKNMGKKFNDGVQYNMENIGKKFNGVYSGLGNSLKKLNKKTKKGLVALTLAGAVATSSGCTHTDAFTTTGFLVGGPVGAVAGYYVGKDLDKEEQARQNAYNNEGQNLYKIIFNNLDTYKTDEMVSTSDVFTEIVDNYSNDLVKKGFPEKGLQLVKIDLASNEILYNKKIFRKNNDWEFENLLSVNTQKDL